MALVPLAACRPEPVAQAADYTPLLAVQVVPEVAYRLASAVQVVPEAVYRSASAVQVKGPVQLEWSTFRLTIGRGRHHTWGKTRRYLLSQFYSLGRASPRPCHSPCKRYLQARRACYSLGNAIPSS